MSGSTSYTKMMTRKATAKDLELKLKRALVEIKNLKEENSQLIRELKENEEESLKIINQNTLFRSELADLHTQHMDILVQRDQLLETINKFDQCSETYEQTLMKINELEVKLHTANKVIRQYEEDKQCQETLQTHSLYEELIGSPDFLYQHRVAFDGAISEVEILDTSNCAIRGCLADHVRWGDAFAVVYSVCERRSFLAAAELLSLLERTRLPGCAAVTLLGNKRDLEHAREVHAEEGQELSLRFGCQFYEVSAAESCAGAALAFHALLREARALALLLPSPRRKLAAYSVSKVIGTIFGKNNKSVRKKRPSLSI